MTDAELDAVEAALGVRFPAAYWWACRETPFRAVGMDGVYWFFDQPADVIRATRAPLGGEYAGPPLLPRYVAIGHGPAGDVYLLDLGVPGFPVVVLSHETHAVEPGWPTFSAFVDEWVGAPAGGECRRTSERAVAVARWRECAVVAGAIALVAVVVPVVVLLLAPRR